MFGGDEVSAIVLDIGSNSARAGYAGEDTPKCVVQTAVGSISGDNTVGNGTKALDEGLDQEVKKDSNFRRYYVGSNALSFRRDGIEIFQPITEGLVNNWEQMEQLWNHLLRDRLRIDPSEHPILVSEPSYNTKANREKTTELMFEKYSTPALFVAKDAVLACFASGKSGGLVIDSGAGTTRVTAVHDGYALTKSIVKTRLAGDFITEEFSRIIEGKGVSIRPHYMIKSKKEIRMNEFEVELNDLPNITDSYKQYEAKHIIRDIKETVFRVSDFAFNEETNANIPAVPYELPDGNTIEIGTDRFKLPELMFNTSVLQKLNTNVPAEEMMSIPQMVLNSIGRCDADLRRELFGGILLTGGNTLFPQFAERLNKELSEKQPPQGYKLRMITPTPQDRKYGVWTGGSILASLGAFQQMWISKQEYEEYGPPVVDTKCP